MNKSDLDALDLIYLGDENLDDIPKRSKEKMLFQCLKCGSEFMKSPYNVFYRSSQYSSCPSCRKVGKSNYGINPLPNNSKVAIYIDHEKYDQLEGIHKYWEQNKFSKKFSKAFSFLGKEPSGSDLRGKDQLASFLLEAVVHYLSVDLQTQIHIDEVAEKIQTVLIQDNGLDFADIGDEHKSMISAIMSAQWDNIEFDLIFELVWNLALQRAQEPQDPGVDPVLMLRKKMLEDMNDMSS